MTIDEARNYLYSSGMSDEQMQTVQRGFICGVLQEIRKEIDDLWYFPNPPYSPAVKAEKISIKAVLEIIDKHIKEYTE